MPAPDGRSGPAAVLRAAGLVAVALAVAIGYVGLPLALAARALLGALPQALVLATAVVVLGTVGVLAVLRRTELVLLPRGRRDARRHGPGLDRRADATAPPDRRALPHAGPTAPPRHRPGVRGGGSWASAGVAGRHRTDQPGRRSQHGTRRR
jgi:hypothetical protein